MHLLQWIKDQDGAISHPYVHDSYISGLRYLDDGQLDLVLDDGKNNIILKIDGILDVGISIEKGAICANLFAWRVSEFPEIDMSSPDNPWRILYPSEDISGILSRKSRMVERYPSHWIVNLSCSYGGNISAICNSFSIYECMRPEVSDDSVSILSLRNN
jgi:hypothetical protein